MALPSASLLPSAQRWPSETRLLCRVVLAPGPSLPLWVRWVLRLPESICRPGNLWLQAAHTRRRTTARGGHSPKSPLSAPAKTPLQPFSCPPCSQLSFEKVTPFSVHTCPEAWSPTPIPAEWGQLSREL